MSCYEELQCELLFVTWKLLVFSSGSSAGLRFVPLLAIVLVCLSLFWVWFWFWI
jgi:hypothetical protein